MKRRLIRLFFSFLLIPAVYTYGQRIVLIPHPPELEDRYTGYTGGSIIYHNKLYLKYTYAFVRYQLAVLNGDSITLIPNPDSLLKPGWSNPGSMIIFNDTLYWQYANSTGNYQLVKFDGSSFSFVANPDTIFSASMERGVQGPIAKFDSNLFFAYICADTDQYTAKLARYDGSVISLVPHDTTFRNRIEIGGGPVIFKGDLYWRFRQNFGHFYIGKFTGDSVIMIPNPDTTSLYEHGGVISSFVIYKDNIYWDYIDASGRLRLSRYNGSTHTFFNTSTFDGSFQISHNAIYKNDLYFLYKNTEGIKQLAKFDGSSISLIPNCSIPNSDRIFSISNLIVYNDKLYFSTDICQLGEYDGNNMRLIPNPQTSFTDITVGICGYPFIFNNILFWKYRNKYDKIQLAMFDGNRIIPIDNPDSAEYESGYRIFNNDPYLQYMDQKDHYRLARLEDFSFIPESEEISLFRIYPNPSTDQITIETLGPFDDYDVSLFTATGKLVLSQSFTGNKVQINISGLSDDIYLVQVRGKDAIELKKITKM